MPPLRAISFDIGDTLVYDVPSVEDRVWSAAQTCGITFDRDRLTAGLRQAETLALAEYLVGRPPETPEVQQGMLREILTHTGGAIPPDDVLAALGAAFLAVPFQRVLHSRALELLATLRSRGFVIGIVSDWEDTLEDMLREMGVMDYADGIAVSAIVGVTKPDPKLFRSVLADLGVSASECLHVGDYLELDVHGAHAAGMSSLLFDWRLRAPSVDTLRVETFDRLCDVLLSLPAPVDAG